jgi:hypothetical protein
MHEYIRIKTAYARFFSIIAITSLIALMLAMIR